MNMEVHEIIIDKLDRQCIAAPAAWDAYTENGDELYLRYRGGLFKISLYENNSYTPLYREEIGEPLDGVMNVYELEEILTDIGVQLNVKLKREFYDKFDVRDCELGIMGAWLDGINCEDCRWSVSKENVPKVEYEHVIPPECPECESNNIEVNTSEPEFLKEMRQIAENTNKDDVLDNLKNQTED